MAAIDWDKPLETVDGVPVELSTIRCLPGRMEVEIDGDDQSRTYDLDGTHIFGSMPMIRNTPEPTPAPPTLDRFYILMVGKPDEAYYSLEDVKAGAAKFFKDHPQYESAYVAKVVGLAEQAAPVVTFAPDATV